MRNTRSEESATGASAVGESEQASQPPDHEGCPSVQQAPYGASGAGGHHDDRGVAAGDNPNPPHVRYLHALFAGMHDACIELRLLREGGRKGLADRRWYRSADELINDWTSVLATAERECAAVSVGVLPRRTTDDGTNANVAPGRVAWVDLDFKDFRGGEADARAQLAKFPTPPSMVVRSGHGLHGYWFLTADADPADLSALSERVAGLLGGDHAFDAARVLRVPGSLNRKDPERPIPVEIESFDEDIVYDIGEFRAELDEVDPAEPEASDRDEPRPEAPGADPSGSPVLPQSVRDAIAKGGKVADYFVGKGKPENGPDGKPTDRSSSGYDHSLIVALVKAEVRDPRDLAAALWHRPDGKARAKGPKYIHRTVDNALASIAQHDEQALDAMIDFTVDQVRVFTSRPASYEFSVNGKTFVLTSAQVRKPSAFAHAFLDTHLRIPAVPQAKHWARLVNRWLENAVRVEMPPEASYEPALREEIEHLIANLPEGESVEDLDAGHGVRVDGQLCFKPKALRKRLRDDYPNLDAAELCRILRDMDFTDSSRRVQGKPVRVWSRNAVSPDTREEITQVSQGEK